MKAVILSAGVGSRIKPLTDKTPKSLLKIGSQTILERMITSILKVSISEIAIVTGYLEGQIKDFVSQKYPELKVTFIRNNLFDKTNTAYSLNLTKDFVAGDSFIKFDGDVVFEDAILEKLVNDPNPNCICIDRDINLAAEEVKVEASEDGKILKVGKVIDPKKAAGESIGIEKISTDAARIFFEQLNNLLKNPANYQRYYDDTYTTLIEKAVLFYTVDITGLNWVEIDTLSDFKNAQDIFITSYRNTLSST